MTDQSSHGAILTTTEIRRTYTVLFVQPMKDARRSLFTPETATITIRDGKHFWIEVEGRNLKTDRYATTGYRITSDGVESCTRRGPAPEWLTALVDHDREANRLTEES